MPTPDDGMTLLPSGVANARTLQSGSPAMYALVSDTTSEGHAWLPAVMPDGDYKGDAAAVEKAFGSSSLPEEGGGDAGGAGDSNPCFPSAASVRSADGTRLRVDTLRWVGATCQHACNLLASPMHAILDLVPPQGGRRDSGGRRRG